MSANGLPPELADSLETAVRESLAETSEWTLREAGTGYRLTLPDRRIVVAPRDGPADNVYWTISLRSDEKIVSKFGPYESIDSVVEQVRPLITADVQYTVCCDG